jgi:BirA family transcriptional regulator, biotin operon repressor / biotin---[acetyl-CoA-carboxylase] ligase
VSAHIETERCNALDALVLEMLLDCDDFVHGDFLSDKLDLPPAELLKRIDSLRSRGYSISAAGGRGYRLTGLPGGLSEREMSPLLRGAEVGRRIHFFAEVGSTNDEAHRLAESGALQGEVVIAERQVQGRGRRGRRWIDSPGSSLLFSVVLRPVIPAARAPELALVGAVAVCEAAREMGAPSAAIKWPNDVESRGRKMAGLLAEVRTDGASIRHAVLGVGLNCGTDLAAFPAELAATATSLAIERGERGGAPVARPVAFARLLESLDEWLALHDLEGFAPVRDRFLELSSTVGRRIRAEVAESGAGMRTVEGEAVDLAEDGALVVRRENGELVRVVAGEVEHCRTV